MDLNKQTNDFVDRLRAAVSIDEMEAVLARFLQQLDFGEYAYLATSIPRVDIEEPILVSTYSHEWLERYMAQGYYRFDPVVERGNMSTVPYIWGTEEQHATLPENPKRLMDEATTFGIQFGFTVPVHGPGNEFSGLSIAANGRQSQFLKQVDEYKHVLHVCAHHYHARVCQIMKGGPEAAKQVDLTPREREILVLVATNYDTSGIAVCLGISEGTVKNHFKSIRTKFDVGSVRQAAILAVLEQYIRVHPSPKGYVA